MYPIASAEAYASWARDHDTLSDADRLAIRACVDRLADKPLFSLVFLGPVPFGAPTIQAVLGQIYPYFQVFASQNALAGCPDSRAVPLIGDTTDPVAAFNTVMAHAIGDFVIALPADAILPPHALFEFADALVDAPDAWVLFSDEDCMDSSATRSLPRFKTAWDPDLMLGRDAVGNLAALRLPHVRAVGGLRPPDTGAADLSSLMYDLVLRLGHAGPFGSMVHVPAVLCHRTPPPASPGPASEGPASLGPASLGPASLASAEARRQVVRRILAERGLDARVQAAPLLPEANRIHWALPASPPLVSILVPTRDRAEMLASCVAGLLSRTDYPHFEVLIIDNDSREPATAALFARLQEDPRVRVLLSFGKFNYARLNNLAVAEARGEVLVLLNNDTDVIAPDWLSEMVSHAIRPGIGAVGAKLLYADETVQHCGVTMGPGWTLTHQLRRSARDDPGPGGELALLRSLSAVTGACLAVRTALYHAVGGLDERNFPVAFNDIDFCLRLGDLGYRNICTPFAEMFHLESTSRGYTDSPQKLAEAHRELLTFNAFWEPVLESDPYHNPNLVYLWESAEYAAPPRRRTAWRAPPPLAATEPRRIYRSGERI
jgi:O-antigen biosynthesis protein